MSTTAEGGCLCARVRYRAEGPPNNTTNCHCRSCQLAAGAAFLTLTEFPRGAVTWLGGEPAWFRSSAAAERGFCPVCGSSLAFRYVDGDTIDVATATFDDADGFMPQDEVWTRSRRAWTPSAETLPRYAEGRT